MQGMIRMSISAWLAAGAVALSAQSSQDAEPAASETPVLQTEDAAPVAPVLDPATAPLMDRAQTYAAYHGDVGQAGQRPLLSGLDLDRTMDDLSAYYSDDRLVNAQIAYAALVAGQHPEFIDAIRSVADYYGPEAAAQGLVNDPLYVTGFLGADDASGSVVGAIGQDMSRIRQVGDRYKQASYDLQAEAWAQQLSQDRAERLSSLETASSRLQVRFAGENGADDAGRTAITSRNGSLGSASALYDQSPDTQMTALPELSLNVGETALQPDERRTSRILAVAALTAIESGDMTYLDTLLNEPSVDRCIQWARLDLGQCVAAGHFKYEDAYCIAEHALNDVADCLTAAQPAAGG